MSTFLQALVVIVVLASFGVGYMSWKTWRIFQVILVVLILLVTLPFYYMAARTLKIHQEWRIVAIAQQKQIDRLIVENHDLEEGAPQKDPQLLGIRELKAQLHDIALDRGAVWRGVSPDKIDEKGAVELSVNAPDPHAIVPQMVLFVFEEEAAGHYLGEFQVSEAPEKSKSIKMELNLPLDPARLDRLKQSRGPWTLYATMPDRQTQDYAFVFWENHEEQLVLNDAIAHLNKNIETTETATRQAQGEVKYRGAEKAALKADLDKFKVERALVQTYLQALELQYQGVREALRATFDDNNKMAAEVTEMQLKAAEAIDLRTRAQAQADSPKPAAQP